MGNHEESGRYAIAGFLYQLIGSGFEALDVYQGLPADQPPTELVVVERFGQDAAVFPAHGSTKKPRMIQYKYSSTNAKIRPQELREILQSFLDSVCATGHPIDQCEFELVTNRDYSPTLSELPTAVESGDRGKVGRLLRGATKSPIGELPELVNICFVLDRKLQTQEDFRRKIWNVGARFGMFDDEIGVGTDRLLGMLMAKAATPRPRIVTQEEIHRAFTGHSDPYELLSEESINRRREDTEKFKRFQTNGCSTIPRSVAEDIARSVLDHSVTVVVGDGGCGKSVAVADAVTICLQDRTEPPGFALVVPAMEAKAEYVMNAVARWRNFEQHQDGQNLNRSVGRLGRAFDKEPLLIVCIEAIDENAGAARLPGDVQTLINELIHQAAIHHQRLGIPRISVVISCRRIEELRKLTRGDKFSRSYNPISVTTFDEKELAILAEPLEANVRDRLVNHLATSVLRTRSGRVKPLEPVSRDALEIIKHPRVWRHFAELPAVEQHQCLDDVRCLDILARKYLKWFCATAEIRQSFRVRECCLSLLAVSQRFSDDHSRPAIRDSDWISPCVSKCGNDRNAWNLFDEALSAGIIVEEESGGRTWRWKQTWLCDYLIRKGIDEL